MIGSEAIILLKRRLARFTADATTLTDADFLGEFAAAQLRLEEEKCLPWWLVTEEATEQTVPNDERVEVPNNFIREIEEDALWIITSAGEREELGKMSLDALRRRYGMTKMQPKAYALMGQYFRLRPIPDIVYNIKMSFFKHDAVVTLVGQNKWLQYEPDLLLAEAGQIIATLYLRDEKAGAAMGSWRQERYTKMMDNELARELANMTGNPED